MIDKLIVINKEEVEKKVKNLQDEYKNLENLPNKGTRDWRKDTFSLINMQINILSEILQSGKPLKPYIEQAFNDGYDSNYNGCGDYYNEEDKFNQTEEYLKQIK